MNNDSIWVKLAYLDKILGTLALNELKVIFGKKETIMYLKWLQERVMDEYLLKKGSQEVSTNLHINVKLHIINYIQLCVWLSPSLGCYKMRKSMTKEGYKS